MLECLTMKRDAFMLGFMKRTACFKVIENSTIELFFGS